MFEYTMLFQKKKIKVYIHYFYLTKFCMYESMVDCSK